MNSRARQDENALTFVTTVAAFALLVAVDTIVHWRGNRFVLLEYVVLGAVASALKTRLPGIPGTISVNCIVMALAIARLSTPQLVAVSVECALVECWWGAGQRITRRQLALYAGVFAISAAIAGWTHHVLRHGVFSPAASVAVASCVLFGAATGALSWYSAAAERVKPSAMWRRWCALSFPYYLLNIGLVAMIVAFSPIPPAVAGLIAAFALSIFVAYRRFLSLAVSAELSRA